MTPTNNHSLPAGFPERWNIIALLLSLDMTQPFWSCVGLTLHSPQVILSEMRTIIIKNRAAPITSLKDPVLRTIAQIEGAAEQFRHWAESIFGHDPSDSTQVFAWSIATGRCLRRGNFVSVGIDPQAVSHLKSCFTQWKDTSAFYKLVDAVDEENLSLWDADMFARHGFSDELDGDILPHPLFWLKSTFNALKVRAFFSQLQTTLSPIEVDAMYQAVKDFVSKEPGMEEAPALLPPSHFLQ
jgi:hypothetical protein